MKSIMCIYTHNKGDILMSLEKKFSETFVSLESQKQARALEILQIIDILNKTVTDRIYSTNRKK